MAVRSGSDSARERGLDAARAFDRNGDFYYGMTIKDNLPKKSDVLRPENRYVSGWIIIREPF